MTHAASPRAETATAEQQRGATDAEKRSAKRFWQRYFDFYDTVNESIPYRQMNERHVALLQPTAADQVLDAGVGTGNLAVLLVETGAQVTGIDFFESALAMCRKKAPEGEYLLGDLTGRLDFEDHRFDKIACCNVIYTLQPKDQANAVRELYRVLKPGGLAAITVFGVGFRFLKIYTETLRLLYQENGLADTVWRGLKYAVNTVRILYYVQRIKGREKTGAYTFFTPESLTELLTSAGFEVDLSLIHI